MDSMKRKSKRHSPLLRIGSVGLAVVTAILFLYGWYFWSNAGRSSDRYGVLVAMIELRFSPQKIIAVSGRPDMLLAKTEYGEKSALNSHMKDLGWQYVDQMGAVSLFRNGNKKREVSHLSMTPFFTVHTLKPPQS